MEVSGGGTRGPSPICPWWAGGRGQHSAKGRGAHMSVRVCARVRVVCVSACMCVSCVQDVCVSCVCKCDVGIVCDVSCECVCVHVCVTYECACAHVCTCVSCECCVWRVCVRAPSGRGAERSRGWWGRGAGSWGTSPIRGDWAGAWVSPSWAGVSGPGAVQGGANDQREAHWACLSPPGRPAAQGGSVAGSRGWWRPPCSQPDRGRLPPVLAS